MEWLNYHHLLYFWIVVREGGVLPAAKKLRLAHSTVSSQIKRLEEQLGEALLERRGRSLELTEVGRIAYGYAEEIFPLGQELLDTLRGRPTDQPIRLRVGVTDAMPKLIVRQLLAPAFDLDEPVQLVCEEGSHEQLLADLAIHRLDVVLAGAPVPPGMHVRAFNHLLGECGVTFFASPELATRLRRRFPDSLSGAPVLLPGRLSVSRRALKAWFSEHGIRPRVMAEFSDSALMKVMGQDGLGAFCAPSVIEADLKRQYEVSVVGRTDGVRERFYAISVERRIVSPAVAAICDRARNTLFADPT